MKIEKSEYLSRIDLIAYVCEDSSSLQFVNPVNWTY
jgi:WD40 repeat protein